MHKRKQNNKYSWIQNIRENNYICWCYHFDIYGFYCFLFGKDFHADKNKNWLKFCSQLFSMNILKIIQIQIHPKKFKYLFCLPGTAAINCSIYSFILETHDLFPYNQGSRVVRAQVQGQNPWTMTCQQKISFFVLRSTIFDYIINKINLKIIFVPWGIKKNIKEQILPLL